MVTACSYSDRSAPSRRVAVVSIRTSFTVGLPSSSRPAPRDIDAVVALGVLSRWPIRHSWTLAKEARPRD